MAAGDLSLGGCMLLFLMIGVFFLCIYLYDRIQKQNLAKKEAAIRENIRRAENGAMAGLDNDFNILDQTQLMDTAKLDPIDFGGVVFVNKKGIHYVGGNRRLSWDWNKLMEIRSYRGASNEPSFFPQQYIYFNLVVSNRQKISGFRFQSTDESQKIVGDFLQKRLPIMKAKNSSNTSKGRTQQKSQPSTSGWNMELKDILLSFDGRINRQRWWLIGIALSVISFISVFIVIFFLAIILPNNSSFDAIVATLVALPFYYMAFCLDIKRLQDTGRSWEWAWISLVGIFFAIIYGFTAIGSGIETITYGLMLVCNFPIAIICGFFEGDGGPNQYGANPLGGYMNVVSSAEIPAIVYQNEIE